VGAAGAVVGHEKLEERERGRAILERDFFWVDLGQPGSTHLTCDPIIIPGRLPGRV